ncbi:Retrovirus-related Pol polyprotein from transposon 297 [Araneus ventricosus]|uniref:RNA-directed DNA polymerase n=1 Tax=Araneus ventricosus TaxID=182803 RepID=A0A4Y2WE68_ARAVE|nr:Retrovirus-related Pol polyprotein from transposon 297 [Araneus ventricosus]
MQCEVQCDANKIYDMQFVDKYRSSVVQNTGINFSDIESAISKFNAESHENIANWLDHFENISQLFSLSDSQKFIFAERSLGGTAALFVGTVPQINSWQKLKQALIDEFSFEINSAHLQELLSKRKMRDSESAPEYFLKMKELCSSGKIEDAALMHYVVKGISDRQENKTILYGCRNLFEFKEKLKVYEVIKSDYVKSKCAFDKTKARYDSNPRFNSFDKLKPKQEHDDRFNSKNESANKVKSSGGVERMKYNNFESRKSKFCFNCGDPNHISRFCVHKDKGFKCFGCGAFGHKASECDEANPKPEVATLGVKFKPRLGNKVTIEDISVNLLIDTGSQATLLRKSVFDKLNMCKLYPLNLPLSGFRKCKVNPLGYFKGNIKIDDFKCNTDIYVVENNVMSYDVIIGMNVLMQGETVINEDGIVIKEKFQRLEEVDSLSVLPIDFTPNEGELNIGPDVPNIFKDKDRFPLPLIEDILDRLQGSRVFSTIDLKNAFFHVDVNKDSRKYTSFVTHEGQYQFLKFPFGLCISPAVFQRYINTIFRPLINDGIVLPYFDDIIILSSSFEERIERVERVLSIASEYGLEINFNKSHFLKKRIEFLGHAAEDSKIFPSTLKTKAVLNFPEQANLKQIHSFLGLTRYFRKFIPKCSTIARPLSDLLKKDRKFKFGEEERISFNQLKLMLAEKSVLRIYNSNYETELHTDASLEGYEAILMQKSPDDKNLHPTFYMSKKTTDAEKKYSSYELEALAVIEAVKKFRVYLLGIPFKIVTDCAALEKTMPKKRLGSSRCTEEERRRVFCTRYKKEDTPLHTYHIDHLGPLESTNKNYKYVSAIIDAFTKFVWIYSTKSTTSAEVIAKLEIQKAVLGSPFQIISDRGTAFTSGDFADYCAKEEIKHHAITTGLPRANGQIERINQTIISVLSKLSLENPNKWYKFTNELQQTINSTYQRSIDTTPFELLFGTKMNTGSLDKLKKMVKAEFQANFEVQREELRKHAK